MRPVYCDKCGEDIPRESDRRWWPEAPFAFESVCEGESAVTCPTCTQEVKDATCQHDGRECARTRQEFAEAMHVLAVILSTLASAERKCSHGEDRRHICDWRVALNRARRKALDVAAPMLADICDFGGDPPSKEA